MTGRPSRTCSTAASIVARPVTSTEASVLLAAHRGPAPWASWASTYLASTSTSRLTGSPTARCPSVVAASVVGMSETSNHPASHRGHREGGAVDGDRALLDDVAAQRVRQRHPHHLPAVARRPGQDLADPVDVPLHDVPAEAAVGPHRPLEVDPLPRHQAGQRAAAQGLGHDVHGEGVPVEVGDGEADAVHRDRVAVADVAGDQGAAHVQPGGVVPVLQGDDLPQLLDDPCEHQTGSFSGVLTRTTSPPARVTSDRRKRRAPSIEGTPRSPTAAGPPPRTAGAR